MEEIPIKLRCAACNKLAVNAFRLPCCEQSICENCKDSLLLSSLAMLSKNLRLTLCKAKRPFQKHVLSARTNLSKQSFANQTKPYAQPSKSSLERKKRKGKHRK